MKTLVLIASLILALPAFAGGKGENMNCGKNVGKQENRTDYKKMASNLSGKKKTTTTNSNNDNKTK